MLTEKPSAAEPVEIWALVEVMGHQRFAGRVTEQQIGGAGFIRVDVPECNGRQGFTRIFSPGAIYAVTPCTEDTARRCVDACTPHPFTLYEFTVRRPELGPADAGDAESDEEYEAGTGQCVDCDQPLEECQCGRHG